MISALLVTASIVAVLSSVSLVMAWKGAVVGHEGENGFVAADPSSVPVAVKARRPIQPRVRQALC